ncbi:MAG: ABC transporter substrate-binding protein [bacterium]|nr:ABC transporter substrate-binding protein [bacterium]
MRRRNFLGVLGGAVVLPLGAQAQSGRVRRIGVLMPLAGDDPVAKARIAAFLQGLAQLGWKDGQNVHIDYRWAVSSADQTRKDAAELVSLAPDVIMVTSSLPTVAMTQATRAIPIVFVLVADPVGSGVAESMARPGGNATGFTPFEYATAGKYLELLKEVAPNVTRVAVTQDAAAVGAMGQVAAIRAAAPSLGVEIIPFDGRDAGAIERAMSAVVAEANGGLIVTAIAAANIHRELFIALAARHRLPAVYPYRANVAGGGLVSYGPDQFDIYRRAADYVDRILKGMTPGDLPVQAPVKYELVVNLKTAKALDLVVPPALLTRADELIE